MELGFNYWVFDNFDEIWYYGTYESDVMTYESVLCSIINNGKTRKYMMKVWIGAYIMDDKNISWIPYRI